ncbi:hypothetical protein [Nocardia sp. NPDC004260]
MTSWLPLISACLIALVTLHGIRTNNHTNRAAISASDEREHLKWRREMLLRLSSEVVESALHAEGDYSKLVHAVDPWTEEQVMDARTTIAGYTRKIGANAAALHMLGATAVGVASVDLLESINNVEFVRAAGKLATLTIGRHGSRAPAPAAEEWERAREDFATGFLRIQYARDHLTRAAQNELTLLGKAEAAVVSSKRRWLARCF